MSTIAQSMRRVIRRGGAADVSVVADASDPVEQVASPGESAPAVEIAPNDPLVAYLQTAGGAVEVDKLELDSPAVAALREAGVALVVPLVSGGELIGTLNLGPRLSDQQYSTDDKKLLDSLAAQAAPALQVAELVRKQATEAASRERRDRPERPARRVPPDRRRRGRGRQASSSTSPGVAALREAGVALVVPLVTGGELDRHAQPRAAALRPAVLDRRQAPARRPRRAGRAGAPGRRARAASRRRRRGRASGSSRSSRSRR